MKIRNWLIGALTILVLSSCTITMDYAYQPSPPEGITAWGVWTGSVYEGGSYYPTAHILIDYDKRAWEICPRFDYCHRGTTSGWNLRDTHGFMMVVNRNGYTLYGQGHNYGKYMTAELTPAWY